MRTGRWMGGVGMAIVLAACGQSSTPSVSLTASSVAPAAPAPVAAVHVQQIGLVMKTLANPFFIEMEKGARRAEKDLGITLLVKTAAQETSIEQQIQLVDDLIAAKADAIVIAPGDSQRMVPVLKRAADAGIKIVNIDNRLDEKALKEAGMDSVPLVTVDNEAGAYKAGKVLAEGITAPTQAALLEGIRSADNAQQRAVGARRGLLENKQVKIVASETANWKIDEAYTVSKALFAKHPQVTLLFAANDMMALGALKYLQEAGKTGVRVAGFDALSEVMPEIKAGHMLATIDQQSAAQGYKGVELAVHLLHGDKVEPVTLIETKVVTKADLN